MAETRKSGLQRRTFLGVTASAAVAPLLGASRASGQAAIDEVTLAGMA
jgi:hypothetical protein